MQKYEILELIATGGMAELYRARLCGAAGFDKQLVVKKILPAYSGDADFVGMLIEEAKLAAQLQHGNVVQVYDLGIADGQYFIVMEYVSGRDLEEVTRACAKQGMKMNTKLAIYIARQVCNGLDYSHRKTGPNGEPLSIIHRDISPQNVLVSFDGEVKITDFGIAKAKTRAQATEVGLLKGKYGYMSPEQARVDPLDHRSDIFNVGIVLHELLVGERLFVGSSDISTLGMTRDVRVTPPSKIDKAIPEALASIVMKALAPTPDRRFQTAEEMEQALSRFAVEASMVAAPSDLSRLMKQLFGKPLAPSTPRRTTRIITLTTPGSISKAPRSSPAKSAQSDESRVVQRKDLRAKSTFRRDALVYLACSILPFLLVAYALWPRHEPGLLPSVEKELEKTDSYSETGSGQRFLPEGLLLIEGASFEGTILVDGKAVEGRPPMILPASIGSEIEIQTIVDGRSTWKGSAELTKSRRLARAMPESTVATTSLRVLSRPRGADVFLDGKKVGRTPLRLDDLPRGVKRMRLEARRHAPWEGAIRLNRNIVRVNPALVPEERAGYVQILSTVRPDRLLIDSEPKPIPDKDDLIAVMAGPRVVRVIGPKDFDRTYRVDVPIGERVRLFVPIPPFHMQVGALQDE